LFNALSNYSDNTRLQTDQALETLITNTTAACAATVAARALSIFLKSDIRSFDNFENSDAVTQYRANATRYESYIYIVLAYLGTILAEQFINERSIPYTNPNYRLTCLGEFFSLFLNLKAYYLLGVLNGIADYISRAINTLDRDVTLDSPNDNGLDDLAVPIYYTVLVEISDDFKKRLVDNEDGSSDLDDSKLDGLRFFMRDKLLYFRDPKGGRERLYILPSIMYEVFEIAYDNRFHLGYPRTKDRINASLWIRNLPKHLREYLDYC
ncbi:hypothetical protein B0A54_16393, partial [Friedmanniomyces endolithicus]